MVDSVNLNDAETPEQSDDDIIKELAALKLLEYDRVRSEKAKAMNVQLKTLDSMVKAERESKQEAKRLPFDEIEPHTETIAPAQLLDEIAATIQKFIVLDTEQAHAAALWVAFTWFIDVLEIAPLAIINAPEKSCGKTQLLTVLGRMAYRPLHAANASPSSLFRAVDLWKPTILIDEADTFFKDNPELHGMVNAGYLRNGFVLRSEAIGDSYEPKAFPVFSAKAIAGVALERHLPDTTLSRGIMFNLRRKLPHESVDRLRHADKTLFPCIASKLARFAADYSQQVREARPTLPDELSDRNQDNWDGLLAVASCAGDGWLQKAAAAALTLSGDSEKSHSISNELLADIHHVFERKETDFLATVDLITELCADDDAAWATYNKGKQISGRQLARLLKPYAIEPGQQRLATVTNPKRGYLLADFDDAFMRYLPDKQDVTRATTESIRYPLQNTSNPVTTRVTAVTDGKTVTLQNNLSVTSAKPRNASVTDNSICNVTEKQSVTQQPIDNYTDIDICNGVTDKSGSARANVTLTADTKRF